MSCGPTGISFLQRARPELLVDLLFDPPHRFWNSEKLGLLAGDGWDAILLTSIPICINDGPWGGSGFLQQLVGAKDEYMAISSMDSCPLFASFLPRVAHDVGREAELGTPAFAQEVWELLRDGSQLRSKGPKPALSRWYSWADAFQYWQKLARLRLL
eukprot:12519261-Alexandrium_andersonii.AAC.1